MNYLVTVLIIVCNHALPFIWGDELVDYGQYYYLGLIGFEIITCILLHKAYVSFLTPALILLVFVQMVLHIGALLNLYVIDYFLALGETHTVYILEDITITLYEGLLILLAGLQGFLIASCLTFIND